MRLGKECPRRPPEGAAGGGILGGSQREGGEDGGGMPEAVAEEEAAASSGGTPQQNRGLAYQENREEISKPLMVRVEPQEIRQVFLLLVLVGEETV